MQLKICGMKYPENIAEVAGLQPEYLGFIFYEKSPRNFTREMPTIAKGIKKVGVFVNASAEKIMEKINVHSLDCIQLHGEETPEFCEQIQRIYPKLELWKVFSIGSDFSFEVLAPYEASVTHFLLDTKGENKGGNGINFDWEILRKYTSEKPFILSGGIGLEEVDAIDRLLKTNLPIHAIDVNSKFEIHPGLKNVKTLKAFKNRLKKIS
jgi:phosphoribosylanthranilate isomerase